MSTILDGAEILRRSRSPMASLWPPQTLAVAACRWLFPKGRRFLFRFGRDVVKQGG